MEKNELKIIVVDDSQFSREQISSVLEENSFDVIGQFESAGDTLNFLNNNVVHLAIVDVVLPGISGFELAQKISENFKKAKIIMISSLSQERVVLESIASGAHDFIQKPIEENILINSVNKILEGFRDDR